MSRINILDGAIAARIAAGEVIVNPAAVVKELMENALDAGATAVTVEITDGGKTLIRVTDNGSGIEPEDVPLAIQKHATSKISGLEDLASIATLGFRGEALASMAAVSCLTIGTRTRGSIAGTELKVTGGGEPELSAAGLPEGTTVRVENLFFNVPARKKFLKNAAQESASIANIVSKTILATPHVSIKYVNNGKTVYQSTGSGELKDALATVYGKDIYDKILPVDYDYANIRITGYLSRPVFLYKNARNLLFYLNGRYIQSKNIQTALLRGYGERVLRSHYPFAVLFIEIPHHLVDVNVHPSKLQVMFYQEPALLDAVTRAVSNALQQNGTPALKIPKPHTEKADEPYEMHGKLKPRPNFWQERQAGGPEGQISRFRSADRLYQKKETRAADSSSDVMNARDAFVPQANFEKTMDRILEADRGEDARQEEIADVREMVDYRVIGQAFRTYLICECNRTLYFIDQHAAHERITYENLKRRIEAGDSFSQPLLVPSVKKFPQQDFQLLSDNMAFLETLGFELEEFGPLTFKFSAFPVLTGKDDADTLIDDVLYELKNHPDNVVLLRDRVIRASCRHSIKAGYQLSEDQISALISELVKLDAIPTCPHGRPVAIAFTREDLQKGFKRTV